MKHTMRWFGPNDPVSLMDIRQAGCTGVVTALHQIPVGDIWDLPAIRTRKAAVEAGNSSVRPLTWDVVESLPVHEAIKKGLPEKGKLIGQYIRSMQNLAHSGIRTICYNFMPVLDWSRTDINYPLPDGATTLRYVWEDFACFDLFILKRKGAETAYSEAVRAGAYRKWKHATPHEISRLTDTVLLGLPGSGEKFELGRFKEMLAEYADIGEEGLRANLEAFLREIGPAAEEAGINLCIHPDDPPRPLLGLPRIVSTAADIRRLLAAYPADNNGLTFCTGSLGVREDNALPDIFRNFADRIHFIHLRSTRRENNSFDFHEAPHLEGDVDMYAVIQAIRTEERRRHATGHECPEIPMRPDHGFRMLDDLDKDTYPGYSAIGRLKGLAELRGLEHAIERNFLSHP